MRLAILVILALAAYKLAAGWAFRVQADPFDESLDTPWGDC